MTTQDIIAGALAFVFLLVLFVVGARKAESPATTLEGENPAVGVNVTPEGERVYSEAGEHYTITAPYPAVGNESARQELEGFVFSQIEAFKGVLEDISPEDEAVLFPDDRKYTLDIEYERVIAEHTTTYIFQIITDTGGAHPNSFEETFTYTTDWERLELEDLFLPQSEYLTKLSEITKAKLIEMQEEFADPNWIARGAAPEEKNFSRFVVFDDHIQFIFPPYAVAPYAAGAQYVDVPKTELEDVLKEGV